MLNYLVNASLKFIDYGHAFDGISDANAKLVIHGFEAQLNFLFMGRYVLYILNSISIHRYIFFEIWNFELKINLTHNLRCDFRRNKIAIQLFYHIAQLPNKVNLIFRYLFFKGILLDIKILKSSHFTQNLYKILEIILLGKTDLIIGQI